MAVLSRDEVGRRQVARRYVRGGEMRRVGGVASLTVALLLLLAIVGLSISTSRLGVRN
jgi:hypothetical protein